MARRFVNPYRHDFCVGLLATAASNGFAVLIPLAFRAAIDDIVQHGSAAPLLAYGLAVIALTGGKGLGDYLAHQRIAGMGQCVAFDLRNQLFTHLQTLSPTYFDQANTGDLMSRMTGDIDALNEMLNYGLIGILGDALALVGIIVILLQLHLPLALLTFLVLPLLIGAFLIFASSWRASTPPCKRTSVACALCSCCAGNA
jgi:ABC-type multidrug transport system fused ATPase/permease subunit